MRLQRVADAPVFLNTVLGSLPDSDIPQVRELSASSSGISRLSKTGGRFAAAILTRAIVRSMLRTEKPLVQVR